MKLVDLVMIVQTSNNAISEVSAQIHETGHHRYKSPFTLYLLTELTFWKGLFIIRSLLRSQNRSTHAPFPHHVNAQQCTALAMPRPFLSLSHLPFKWVSFALDAKPKHNHSTGFPLPPFAALGTGCACPRSLMWLNSRVLEGKPA